ncbi:MAG: hypothetical protein GYB23_04145 [Vibrionaceae bacterium]|nr:hypothetical protein [Vibrionaceae bacterium]
MVSAKKWTSLALACSTIIVAGCGGGSDSANGRNTDENTGGGNTGSSNGDLMPYTAELITPTSYSALGSDIQYVNEPNDNLCTYGAIIGQCEYYSYKSVAYSIPAEIDSTSMDDMATTIAALQEYVKVQSTLWGLSGVEDLMAVAAFGFKPLDSLAIDLIAYDLERQAAFQPTVIDSSVLTAASAATSDSDTCTELGYGALITSHCKATRYVDSIKAQLDWQITLNDVLRSVSSEYEATNGYYDSICATVTSAQAACYLDGTVNTTAFNEVVALFGSNKSAQVPVQGFAYNGDNNKGGYVSGGSMNLPNNLSSFPDFDAKVFNHEFTHFVIDKYMAGSSVTFNDRVETRFFEEGIPVLFAKQQVWTWAKMAEMAQSGSNYLLTLDEYNTRGSLVNYLLVAKTKAEAQGKHEALLKFVKSVKAEGSIATAFNNAGFTNHKGEAVTIDSFGSNIATWVTELANDPQVGSYKSVAYNDFK